MKSSNSILRQQVCEQIALEEQLCDVLKEQIKDLEVSEFVDARELLIRARGVLEGHFLALNELLDRIDQVPNIIPLQSGFESGNGLASLTEIEQSGKTVSQILRDDFCLLNSATIANIQLHTTALVLNSNAVAAVTLKHLENFTQLVARMSYLIPDVVTKELFANTDSPDIDLTIAESALNNTKQAWRKAL